MLFFGDPYKHAGLTARLKKLKVKDAVEIHRTARTARTRGSPAT